MHCLEPHLRLQVGDATSNRQERSMKGMIIEFLADAVALGHAEQG